MKGQITLSEAPCSFAQPVLPQLQFTALLPGLVEQIMDNLNASENGLNIKTTTTSWTEHVELKICKQLCLSVHKLLLGANFSPSSLMVWMFSLRLGLLNCAGLNLYEMWSTTKSIQALVNLKFMSFPWDIFVQLHYLLIVFLSNFLQRPITVCSWYESCIILSR